MPVTGTPVDVLTSINPTLNKTRQKEGDVTKSDEYTELDEEELSYWGDFTYENIMASFGNLLTSGTIEADVTAMRQGSPFEIHNEKSIYKVMEVWNLCICRDVLKVGAAQIQAQLGLPRTDITMRVQEKELRAPGFKKPLEPDFCIYAKDSQETVLVWGENKLSSKWKSDKEALPAIWRKNWIWPFRQLATYLVTSNTRYGCLLTPDELVVVRLYSIPPQNGVKHNLQWASIPWESAGRDRLTVNIGLWAMAMMALNDDHRAIVDQTEVLPLNVWWKEKDDKGDIIYVHHLTGVTVSRLPARAIARDRPAAVAVVREAKSVAEASTRSKRPRRH